MTKKKVCAVCGYTTLLHFCTDCGKWFCEKHIEYGEEPYQSDIHDDHTKVWQCEKCRQISRDEI